MEGSEPIATALAVDAELREVDKRGTQRAGARARLRALLPIRGQLLASYLCAALVLVVGLASFVQMQAAEDSARRADDRRRILRTVLGIQIGVLNAEVRHRGYLLTLDPSFLTAQASETGPPINTRLRDVEELALGDAEQGAIVKRIVHNTRLKLNENSAAAAALRVDHASAPTSTLLHSQRLTDQISDDTEALLSTVRMIRDGADRRATGLTTFTKWFIVLGNAVAFSLAVAVTLWTGRAFRQAQQAGVHLATYSRQIEEHAMRLAAQEQLLAERLTQERALSQNLQRTNQALTRSNADLEQFAYVASHDLRAPLRGIASLTDWIEEDLGSNLPSSAKKHMDTLRGRVARLDALISGIATYSRAGRRTEALERVDVAQVVRDTVELTAGSGVEVRATSPLPTIEAPRTPLQQIFLNLISNAIKHGAADHSSVIEIAGRDEGHVWQFSVTDHGPGIAPEYHEKIFALFHRLSSRDRVEGTGIGLALVKKLVERYGGRVWVESTVGTGSTFLFTWPKRVRDELA